MSPDETAEQPKILYTSDDHFWHVNGVPHCPARGERWGSVEEMNEAAVENWNRVVRPQDTVWHLGDVVMGKVEESVQIARRLNGRKLLVPGNHDRMFSANKKGREAAAALYESVGFEIADEQVRTTIHDEVTGKDVPVLSVPLPVLGGSHRARAVPSAPSQVSGGIAALHGHIHQNGTVDRARKSINVGVDVPAWNFTPVAEQQVADVIAGREAA